MKIYRGGYCRIETPKIRPVITKILDLSSTAPNFRRRPSVRQSVLFAKVALWFDVHRKLRSVRL